MSTRLDAGRCTTRRSAREALIVTYAEARGVNTAITRLFNTYGPRMRSDDGRIMSNFITQALRGDALTVYGDGSQTRSFQYVDDLVRGLVLLAESTSSGPINLGTRRSTRSSDLLSTHP